ncbi:hypothetical protein PPERSA_08063 [Pseudocohnilembus persalinus]|uniref:C2 domain n=1 Tax=Pseudocohnilembus persalinus TaxID=266149 RepID=A0A0V0R367_PSEPJ|nr:hypothetical protein PPERSA_08063 [Pseudocohnilembus persalinus]|eukprot:KRX08752.1 hypothetical protein PPERSA_08063 [Pseudocohnilembus persalinus]
MNNNSQIDQSVDPEIQFLEKPYRPKPRVRDEKDIRYQEKLKQQLNKSINNNESTLNVQNSQFFEPTQDLIMEKEKIKREKLFSKQVANIIKIEVNKASYILEPQENHLKWDLKQYQKNVKQREESVHMKQAGLSFAKGDKSILKDETKEEIKTEEKLEDQIYIETKIGSVQYKSNISRAFNTITEQGEKNPYEFEVQWQDQEFEFSKTTETIVYFTVKIKDPDSDYKMRYPWLKAKYQGDSIIGRAKLDLAQLVVSKDKEDTRIKEVRIRREDNNEIIGSLNVGITYKKADYEKNIPVQLKHNLLISNLQVEFGKADITKIKELLEGNGDIQYYVKVRVGQNSQATELSQSMSISSQEEYKFNANPEVNKIYIEAHLRNQEVGFTECIGIGFISFNQLQMFQKGELQAITDCQIKLSYKGKPAGSANFKVTQFKEQKPKLKKKQSAVDIKEKSKPTELDLKRQRVLEAKKELNQQKFYELNYKKVDPLKKLASSTDQLQIKKKVGELVLPAIKTNYNSNPSLFINQSMISNNQSVLNNNSMVSKSMATISLDRKPIPIERVQNNRYKRQIMGSGFSKMESAATLQRSVHHFSIPKSSRFQMPKNLVPGPNTYNSIGLLEEMEKIDKKLQQKRQKDFQEYKKYQNV